MSDLGQDYIDLIASGDKRKIGCVLLAAGAAAGVSGLAAGTYFAPANVVPGAGTVINATAAGIGAVLGALFAAKSAYNLCGGESTRNSFDNLFKTGKVDKNILDNYESSLIRDFGVSSSEARVLSKAAHVYSSEIRSNTIVEANLIEKKNAVTFLLNKLSSEGIS